MLAFAVPGAPQRQLESRNALHVGFNSAGPAASALAASPSEPFPAARTARSWPSLLLAGGAVLLAAAWRGHRRSRVARHARGGGKKRGGRGGAKAAADRAAAFAALEQFDPQSQAGAAPAAAAAAPTAVDVAEPPKAKAAAKGGAKAAAKERAQALQKLEQAVKEPAASDTAVDASEPPKAGRIEKPPMARGGASGATLANELGAAFVLESRSKEQGKKKAATDLAAAFSASPLPTSGKAPSAFAMDDDRMAALGLRAQRPVPMPELKEKKAEEEEEEEEKEAADDGKEEGAEDEPAQPKRRRGEQDAVEFNLEAGLVDGEVAVGLKEIAVRLGGRLVLQDASWTVKTGDKLALVGANGCGKTTMLKVLTGELEPDEGEVIMNKPNIKISTLEQGFVDDLDMERELRDELLSAVPIEARIRRELQEVELEIKNCTDLEIQAQLIEKLTALNDESQARKVYELDDRMARIVKDAGFLEEDLTQKVGVFSGGWKVRIGLAKIFMTAPDVLLLDEPTNHLDMESVEWLEDFIQRVTLPVVVVSHDREFMDRVCNRVVDTVDGMTFSYKGSYSEYVTQRDRRMEKWEADYELQQKRERAMVEYIKTHKNKQAMAQARARKQSELEAFRASPEYLDPPPRLLGKIKFQFPEPAQGRRGGRDISALAWMSGVTHGYGEDTLLEEASFSVSAGEAIGVVGRNGAGKSTLVRLLLGQEEPSGEGKVSPPDASTTGYFTQHQADLLPRDRTAMEIVREANDTGASETELMEMMRRFRFKGKRLDVKAESLSGGERARLAIVCMMLRPAKLLVLDEPTNHLDIPMKETLEYSLRNFQGGVLIVSHDRYFLSQVCRKIVEIKDGEVVSYDGDFLHYMESNRELQKKIEKRYVEGTIIGGVPETAEEQRSKRRGKKEQVTFSARGGKRVNWRRR